MPVIIVQFSYKDIYGINPEICYILLTIYDFTKNDEDNKRQLLSLFRDESKRLLAEVNENFKDTEYKKRSSWLNSQLGLFREEQIGKIEKSFDQSQYSREIQLNAILHTTYASYVVMLEARNKVWPYEYMAFSRRIGELWEPFCQLAWRYPIATDVSIVSAPSFKEAREQKINETSNFINSLEIDSDSKEKLKKYYDEIWALLDSGGIRLDLDLHYKKGTEEIASDFKSGFSSNEKGNTNRLLLVASIYRMLQGYKTVLFVRQEEGFNNHYLKTLINSGLWEVYCGEATYKKIHEITGFDLATWIKKNIDWVNDLDKDTADFINKNSLSQYLVW